MKKKSIQTIRKTVEIYANTGLDVNLVVRNNLKGDNCFDG